MPSLGSLLDYLLNDYVILAIFVYINSKLYFMLRPYKQTYRRSDESLNKPFIWPLTISFYHVLSFTALIPTVVVVLGENLSSGKPMENVIKRFSFGWVCCGILVTTIKNVTGRLRPHFLHANRIGFDASDHANKMEFENKHPVEATGKRIAAESRRSFFSGHAMLGMYAAAFVVIYLQVKAISDSLIISGIQILAILVGLYPGITQGRTYWVCLFLL